MTRRIVRAFPLQPAFYVGAEDGLRRDVLAVLHLPYTAWHLSFVVIGATLAPTLAVDRLAGTLLAFFLGTGIAAHALDEWNGRPLRTSIAGGWLIGTASAALAGSLALAVVGAAVISGWVVMWALLAIALVVGYATERPRWVHSDVGFALSWGAFPVVVGYWAQAERIGLACVLLALSMTCLSLAQRSLSTAARALRRNRNADERGDRADLLLASWEEPLRWLAATAVTLALGLLAARTGL